MWAGWWNVWWTILYVFCLVIILRTSFFFFCMCCIILSNGSKVCKSDEGLLTAFKVFILHAGNCDSASFFPLKLNLFRILTLSLALPNYVLLTSSNLTSGGIWSDFIWEQSKFEKLWIQAESLTLFVGLHFWKAFTVGILLPIIPFLSSWILPQVSHFSASQVQLLNGDVIIVLCLLMVVQMTEKH